MRSGAIIINGMNGSSKSFSAVQSVLSQAGAVLGPLVLLSLLPFGISLIILLLLFFVLSAYARWPGAAAAAHTVLPGAAIGLGVSAWVALNSWYGLFACLALVAGAWALLIRMETSLTTKEGSRGSEPQTANSSLYGVTPEGEELKFVDAGGSSTGPSHLIFPDGVVLARIGNRALFLQNGRYFAAEQFARDGPAMIVLDRYEKQVYYTQDMADFPDLGKPADIATAKARAPKVEDDMPPGFSQCLANASGASLAPVADLWLEPEAWPGISRNDKAVSLPPPAGNHKLEIRRYLPDSLLALPDPLNPLEQPVYRLMLDGDETGLVSCMPGELAWRADGLAFACRAHTVAEQSRRDGGSAHSPAEPFQVWVQGAGWGEYPPLNELLDGQLPYSAVLQGLRLEENALWLDVVGANPELSKGDCGHGLSLVYDVTRVCVGYTDEGRMELADNPSPAMCVRLSLDPSDQPAVMIRSRPMADERTASFSFEGSLADLASGGASGWDCRMGDWQLSGRWLPDHRVSSCGRYVALSPFPSISTEGEGPICTGVVVADPARRRLWSSPPLLMAGIHDFTGQGVSVVAIAGSLTDREMDKRGDHIALAPYSVPAPEPDRAPAFFGSSRCERFYHERIRFSLEPDKGLVQQPFWRQVNRPQRITTRGDFVYPNPTGDDAAWLFGGHNESCAHGEGETPQTGDFVRTASGFAVGELAPCMIWSVDGRYLVLTQSDARASELGFHDWRLLLLDTELGMLHRATDSLKGTPHFESLDAEGLILEVSRGGYSRPGDTREKLYISQADLLAMPAVALPGTSPRLPPEEGAWLKLWTRQNTEPLAGYLR